ncbi:hypothetical protein [Peribacillus muralis]|uniref:hypothetical protein n=1 Tax=Peribacillus muralis TaxID=264697 RepID=UPI00070A7FFE|nr:hypothetical protein [Peribacillus muralis]
MFNGILSIMLLQFLLVSPARSYYKSYDNLSLHKVLKIYLFYIVINFLLLLLFVKVNPYCLALILLVNGLVIIIIHSKKGENSILTDDMDPKYQKILLLNQKTDLLLAGGLFLMLMISFIRFHTVLDDFFGNSKSLLIYTMVLAGVTSVSYLYYYFKSIKEIKRFFEGIRNKI